VESRERARADRKRERERERECRSIQRTPIGSGLRRRPSTARRILPVGRIDHPVIYRISAAVARRLDGEGGTGRQMQSVQLSYAMGCRVCLDRDVPPSRYLGRKMVGSGAISRPDRTGPRGDSRRDSDVHLDCRREERRSGRDAAIARRAREKANERRGIESLIFLFLR